MSHCPNCEKRLTIFHWRPVCPHCGVNLTFFNFEERFLADAKNTELGFAKVRVQTARLKGAYIGSRLAIARLIVCVLPAAAFLVPFSKLTFHLPMADEKYSFGVFGVLSLLQNQALPYLLQLARSEVVGDVFSQLFAALIAFAVTVLFALLPVLAAVLCFLSVKKCAAAACVFSGLGIASSAVTIFLSNRFIETATEKMPQIVSASRGFGGYVVIAAFAVSIIVNLLFLKQGLMIRYAEGDLHRVEIAKKIKRGELKLEELPFPIFETDEEREMRLAEEEADAEAEVRRAARQGHEEKELLAAAVSSQKGGGEV